MEATLKLMFKMRCLTEKYQTIFIIILFAHLRSVDAKIKLLLAKMLVAFQSLPLYRHIAC